MKNEYKTRSRNAIFDYLKENRDRSFTARDIMDTFSSQGEEVDKSTIYRNLERLCKEGRLISYKDKDINGTCYQYSDDNKACNCHIHAKCSDCGKIYHLDNELFKDVEKNLKDKYGIDIDYGKTIIVGKCSDCSKSKNL